MEDLISDFVSEAAESLGGLRMDVARLALDHVDGAAAADVLRRLHGLKGLCSFVNFERAEALVHAGESLAVSLVDRPASPAVVTALSRMIEQLGVLLAFAADHRAEPQGEDAELIALIESIGAISHKAPANAAVAPLHPMPPALSERSWPEAERRARAPWFGLDNLAQALGDRLGKRIDLVVGGDDLRIAPEAARPLRTALIALVRNACDHGVESPGERRAAGKPAQSLLRLMVHRTAGGAIIELADDGRGVDPDRIRAHCVAAGRLGPDEAAALDAPAAQALIFSSGVSTAASVGPISGRGLGLDLVRTELTRLGGGAEVDSIPGLGSRFVLILPASALAAPTARRRVAA